jgi:hypothetical protein
VKTSFSPPERRVSPPAFAPASSSEPATARHVRHDRIGGASAAPPSNGDGEIIHHIRICTDSEINAAVKLGGLFLREANI